MHPNTCQGLLTHLLVTEECRVLHLDFTLQRRLQDTKSNQGMEQSRLNRRKSLLLANRNQRGKPSDGQSHAAYDTILIKPPKKPSTGKPQPAAKSTSKSQSANKHQQIEKDTTVKDQSTKGYLAANTQHWPPYIEDIHAIRLTCDKSAFRMNRISLTKKGPGGLGEEKCVELEKWLERFPNMRSCYDQDPKTSGFKIHPDTFKVENRPDTFSFEHRSLIGIPATDMDGSDGKTDYFMYCCYEKGARLPLNSYLSGLSGVHMYGDAFLFKMEGYDKVDRPNFQDMPPDIDLSTIRALLNYRLEK